MNSTPNGSTSKDAAEETARMAADYSSSYTEYLTRRFHIMYLISIVTMFIYMAMRRIDFSALPPTAEVVLSFIQGTCLGIGLGMLIVGAIFTSKYGNKIIAFKVQMLKHKS